MAGIGTGRMQVDIDKAEKLNLTCGPVKDLGTLAKVHLEAIEAGKRNNQMFIFKRSLY